VANAAKAHGLAAEAIAVEGNHRANADNSLTLALQLFQQFN
jgi:hypothetical protein